MANLVPQAPQQPSSWLKSVSVPLDSASLVPTEVICKGAGVGRGGPALTGPFRYLHLGLCNLSSGWEGTLPLEWGKEGQGLGRWFCSSRKAAFNPC